MHTYFKLRHIIKRPPLGIELLKLWFFSEFQHPPFLFSFGWFQSLCVCCDQCIIISNVFKYQLLTCSYCVRTTSKNKVSVSFSHHNFVPQVKAIHLAFVTSSKVHTILITLLSYLSHFFFRDEFKITCKMTEMLFRCFVYIRSP